MSDDDKKTHIIHLWRRGMLNRLELEHFSRQLKITSADIEACPLETPHEDLVEGMRLLRKALELDGPPNDLVNICNSAMAKYDSAIQILGDEKNRECCLGLALACMLKASVAVNERERSMQWDIAKEQLAP